MAKRDTFVRATAEEIRASAARDGDGMEWARIDATTPEQVELQAAEDGTDVPDAWWDNATLGLPPPKQHVNLRIDADVLGWFKATGKGYQTRMNNVLRAFVESRKSAG